MCVGEFVGSIGAVNEQLCREGLSRHSFIEPLVSEHALMNSVTPDALKKFITAAGDSSSSPKKHEEAEEEDNAALVEVC